MQTHYRLPESSPHPELVEGRGRTLRDGNNMDKIAWVYMLKCADGRYYIGSHRGADVGVRVSQHQFGTDPKAFTYRRRPVELVWASEFPDAVQAIAVERQLKGWKRAKKEALIRGDWREIERLSRGASPRPSTGSG